MTLGESATEEPKFIVFGDRLPRRGEMVQARGQDQPSQGDGPRMADRENWMRARTSCASLTITSCRIAKRRVAGLRAVD